MNHYTGAIPNTTSPDTNWRGTAACVHEDAELFFPTGTTGPALAQIEEAKAVCWRCPALDDCRQWALDNRIEHGVWGGTSEHERRSYLRQRARRRHQEHVPETRPVGEELQRVYDEHTERVDGGHLLWTWERQSIYVGEVRYTFAQFGFRVGYEREPIGQVQRSCDRLRCVAREHLTDSLMRAQTKANA